MACNDRNAPNTHANAVNPALFDHDTHPPSVYNAAPPGCFGNRWACIKARSAGCHTAGQGHNHTVCEACVKDTTLVLELQPLNYLGLGTAVGQVRTRIDAVSPFLNPAAPIAVAPNFRQTWQTPQQLLHGRVRQRPVYPIYNHDGFQTRLCTKCESIEQAIATRRHNAFTMTPAAASTAAAGNYVASDYYPGQLRTPSMREITQWHEYPWSTCTCYYWLGLIRPTRLAAPAGLVWDVENPRICLSHRQQILNDLNAKRDANDSWLQNIFMGRTGLRRVLPAARKDRVRRGWWRACRCGEDIDHFDAQGNEIHVPQIFQCLGCEGTRNLVGNANGVAVLNALATQQVIERYRPATMDLGYSATRANGDRPRCNLGQIKPL